MRERVPSKTFSKTKSVRVYLVEEVRVLIFLLEEVLVLTVIFIAMNILAGASPYKKLAHTALSSFYQATLCSPSLIIMLSSSDNIGWTNPKNINTPIIDRILLRLFPDDDLDCTNKIENSIQQQSHQRHVLQKRHELVASYVIRCILAVLIPIQILLLYDRGWQIQRWPVPSILGGTIAWIIGILGGVIMTLMYPTK
jgi:hypothetical protein